MTVKAQAKKQKNLYKTLGLNIPPSEFERQYMVEDVWVLEEIYNNITGDNKPTKTQSACLLKDGEEIVDISIKEMKVLERKADGRVNNPDNNITKYLRLWQREILSND